MAIAKWLSADAVSQLVAVATELGKFREIADFQGFDSALTAAGMAKDEIQRYWDAIDCTFPASIYSGDRRVSAECGILLCEQKFPRNFLLYRLAQCMYPSTLRVTIEVVDHKHEIGSSRWEYVGGGKKRVMKIGLFADCSPVAKKSKPKLRRRPSIYKAERVQ